MNKLTTSENVNGVTITTLEIAEMMNTPHYEILKKLEGTTNPDGTIRQIGIIPTLSKGKIPVTDYFIKSVYKTGQNKEMPCYEVTRLGCDFLANKFTGEKGILFTARYVKKFNEMEKALMPKIPQTYKEALLETVRLLDENEKLQADNRRMKPKEIFADAVTVSDTCILIGELAKIIKQNGVDIGQNRLFTWMRDNGYLISRKGTDYNMPMQKSMDLGLFEIKERTINNPDGSVRITKTVLVTGKGQQYFINKFLNCS